MTLYQFLISSIAMKWSGGSEGTMYITEQRGDHRSDVSRLERFCKLAGQKGWPCWEMWEQRVPEDGEPERTGSIGVPCSEPSVDTGHHAASRTHKSGSKRGWNGCLTSWEPSDQTAWLPVGSCESPHFVLLGLGLLEQDANLRAQLGGQDSSSSFARIELHTWAKKAV